MFIEIKNRTYFFKNMSIRKEGLSTYKQEKVLA